MEMPIRRNWTIVGIPDHTAVTHLTGRVGAVHGPRMFRELFSRFKSRLPVMDQLVDRGDVIGMGEDVATNHRLAADAIRDSHQNALVSVAVGGSHDHGYSHLLGLKEAFAGKRLGCINLDAHLDVRKPAPQITSGSPFYLAIENGVILPQDLVEFGIQDHCNGNDLWEYVESKGVPVIRMAELIHGAAAARFEKELESLCSRCDVVAVSFDLDAVAECHAPGVSAPQSEGLSSTDSIQIMKIAGRNPKVVSLGIFELNPEHDIGERTARLAATSAFYFAAEALGRA